MTNPKFDLEALEPRRLLSVAINTALTDVEPWVQQTTVTAPSVGTVAIDGNTMVVVGDGDTAYVFTKSDSAWTETAKLTDSDGAGFGSVAISGNTIVAGASYANVGANYYEGAAYVFTEPATGWTDMTQTARLTPSDGQSRDFFGSSVSISGKTIVVGSLKEGASDQDPSPGAAYVFTEAGTAWTDMTQTAKLTASDGQSDDYFGGSVAISGNTVVASGGGKVYLFSEPDSGWTDMTQTAELTASDGSYCGSVAISGNTVVAGAAHQIYDMAIWPWPTPSPGTAYVFTEPATGWTDMTQTAKLTDSAGTADFGFAVAISGNTIVIGAQQNPEPVFLGPYPGSAYVFTEGDSGWTDMTQTADLTPADGNVFGFGWSVSVSGNTVVTGSYNLLVGMLGSTSTFNIFGLQGDQVPISSTPVTATPQSPNYAAANRPTSPFADGTLIASTAGLTPGSATVLATNPYTGDGLYLLATPADIVS